MTKNIDLKLNMPFKSGQIKDLFKCGSVKYIII